MRLQAKQKKDDTAPGTPGPRSVSHFIDALTRMYLQYRIHLPRQCNTGIYTALLNHIRIILS
jgi:hypothetical protein